jgi:hypothetical protein
MSPFDTVYLLIEQHISSFPKIELRGTDYSTILNFREYVQQVVNRCRELEEKVIDLENEILEIYERQE